MKRALWFGADNYSPGHYLRLPYARATGRVVWQPDPDVPNFPWNEGLLDTGLLKNGKIPDVPDGRVHWTCSTRWIAFYWWDRSGDSRSNSNSGFYVEGFDSYSESKFWEQAVVTAFEFACATWPDVVRRQIHPLTLTLRP